VAERNSKYHFNNLAEGELISPFRPEDTPLLRQIAYEGKGAQTAAEQSFDFLGIRGKFSLLASEDLIEGEHRETILGPVETSVVIHDGEITLTNPPLIPWVEFIPKSIEEFETLRDYKVKLQIAGRNFLWDCNDGEEREVAETAFARGETLTLMPHPLWDESGRTAYILLPCDPEITKSIFVEIVRKNID
jgi:hypothetical protein